MPAMTAKHYEEGIHLVTGDIITVNKSRGGNVSFGPVKKGTGKKAPLIHGGR